MKIQCRVHKNPPLDPVLCQIDPIYVLINQVLTIHLHVILIFHACYVVRSSHPHSLV
jgi:uncharacterized membrane protein YqaE (UPF0057 family)